MLDINGLVSNGQHAMPRPPTATAVHNVAQYIKISMLFLEDEDAVSAETFIKKASSLIASCTDRGLEVQYKVRWAVMSTSAWTVLAFITSFFVQQLSQRASRLCC